MNLPELVPPVVACFADPDPKVRYMACEALFNITKIARSSSLIFFKDIFNSIAKVACCMHPMHCLPDPSHPTSVSTPHSCMGTRIAMFGTVQKP